jgi:hypothetical protein
MSPRVVATFLRLTSVGGPVLPDVAGWEKENGQGCRVFVSARPRPTKAWS